MNDIEKVVVIISIELDKHIVSASGVMTFHHLWNLTQFLHYIVEFLRILQVKSDESAGLIAYFLRVNIKLATFEYADVGQFLYALMNASNL